MTDGTEGVKAGHTAWKMREVTDTLDIAYAIEEGKSPVADVYDSGCSGAPHTEVSKRARLIAAAPDGFDVIEAFIAVCDTACLVERDHPQAAFADVLRAAFEYRAKAQGPSNG